jgi:hypothetical protein
MTTSRLAAAPDIPTVDEAGMPGLYLSIWVGLWAPKGTPKNVIGRLNAAAVDVMDNPTARARLADLGIQFPPREKETRRRSARFKRPRSRNGGRSSRSSGSRRNEPAAAASGPGLPPWRVAWLRSRSRPVAIDDAIIAGCCS